MKSLIACMAFATIAVAFGQQQTFQQRTRNMTPEQREEYQKTLRDRRMKRTGGMIRDTRKMKGSIVFLNLQKMVAQDEIKDIPTRLQDLFRCNVEFKTETGSIGFNGIAPAIRPYQGSLVVMLTEDADLPSLLVAPEGKWAVVNVRPLADENVKVFSNRVRREMMRAFGFVAAADTTVKGSVLNAVQSLDDLDELVGEALGQEAIMIINQHLEDIGIVGYTDTTYLNACEEGWAPAPTNEIQKAIWDKVHSIPDKPLKIQFDPASQKGKVTK